MVLAPDDSGKPVHCGLGDGRNAGVKCVGRLATLEEHIGVLRGAANEGVFGAERAGAMGADEIVVDQLPDLRVADEEQRVDLVRGAEAVEEMDERHARFERRHLGDQSHVVRFLHGGRGQHGKARGARRHHVGMVAEDREGLCREGPRRDMKDGRRQLAGDLVHVGEHQHEPLRRSERGGQRAGLERAMHGAGGAALALHLLNDWNIAPDIGEARRAPLVGALGHGRGGRDRKDRADLVDAIGDVGDGGVAVHGDSEDVFSHLSRSRRTCRWRGMGSVRHTHRSRYSDRDRPDSGDRGRA